MCWRRSRSRLRDRERVGGVDPILGKRGGVRLFTDVMHLELREREDGRLDDVDRRRMDHHRRVHAGERAALE